MSSVKKYIHVNQHNIRHNRNSDEKKPVITCKTYKDNRYGNEIEVSGPCKIVYRPDRPLSCGATVWIETNSEVRVIK